MEEREWSSWIGVAKYKKSRNCSTKSRGIRKAISSLADSGSNARDHRSSDVKDDELSSDDGGLYGSGCGNV